MTTSARLSCRSFAANQVRLQLHVLAYNLGNFLRRIALPASVKHWSLTTLRDEKESVAEGKKIVPDGDIERKIQGTRWTWIKDGVDQPIMVEFQKHGKYVMHEPNGLKRIGTWKPTASNSIQIVSPDGEEGEIIFSTNLKNFMAVVRQVVRIGRRR